MSYYQKQNDPLFIIRKVHGLTRGHVVRNEIGALIKPTDNSPAWWIHYQLYLNHYRNFDTFDVLLNNIPSHMFNIELPESINSAGWHVAHLFSVINGNTEFNNWDRIELLRRTALNIHPCNCFYISKVNWQQYGDNPAVISFFYKKLSTIYKNIWNEFLSIIQCQHFTETNYHDDFHYIFP